MTTAKQTKDEGTAPPAVGIPLDRQVRPLVERLRSRAWEDRHHREYREEAALEIERLQDMLFERGAMRDAPCFCCGYSGPGYYQPSTHRCARRHHALQRGRL